MLDASVQFNHLLALQPPYFLLFNLVPLFQRLFSIPHLLYSEYVIEQSRELCNLNGKSRVSLSFLLQSHHVRQIYNSIENDPNHIAELI